MTTGSDGGLFVLSSEKWFDAAFTTHIGYNNVTNVPEVGAGWQILPVPQVVGGSAGHFSKYVSVQDGCVVLQPGTYFGIGLFREYNTPSSGTHTNYLNAVPLDNSSARRSMSDRRSLHWPMVRERAACRLARSAFRSANLRT